MHQYECTHCCMTSCTFATPFLIAHVHNIILGKSATLRLTSIEGNGCSYFSSSSLSPWPRAHTVSAVCVWSKTVGQVFYEEHPAEGLLFGIAGTRVLYQCSWRHRQNTSESAALCKSAFRRWHCPCNCLLWPCSLAHGRRQHSSLPL